MSSLRAVQLPTQPLERVAAAPTQAYLRPRVRATVPPWEQHVENGIRAVARFGCGPIPTVVLVFVLAVSISSR